MSEDRITYTGRDELFSSSSNIAWINSYNGGRIEYLYDNIGCIKCDNYLKFFAEDGSCTYFANVESGISAFATHKINSIFAVAENITTPKICIVHYPSFEIITELKGESESLGYALLEFSSTNLLASISGIPLDELIIWKYTEGTKMYSCKIINSSNYILMFNPINPKQFAMCSEKEILIWSLSDSVQRSYVALPSVKSSEKSLMDEYSSMGNLSTNDFIRSFLDLPRSCIVHLTGKDLNEFEERLRSSVKVIPSALCWSMDGIIFIGCQRGEMFKILDNKMVPLVYEDVSSTEMNSVIENIPKQIGVMLVHKNILVIGGQDGILKLYELIGNIYKYVDMTNINQKISYITHVTHLNKMLIGTEDGSIFSIYWSNTKKLNEIFYYENSLIIAMGVLPLMSSSYVTLKSTGLVTVWGIDGTMLSSLRLDPKMEATSMGVSSLLNLVVIGTTSGFVYLGNFVNFSEPKWLSKLTIHTACVVCVKFFKGGKFFALGYEDGHVFIVSGVPSQNFNVIGYIEVGGKLLRMSVFDGEKSYSVGVLYEAGDQQYVTMSAIDRDVLHKKPEYLLTKYQFKKFMTNKVTCPLESPAVDLAVIGVDSVVLLHTDRTIMSYKVANYDHLTSSDKTSLEVEETNQEEESLSRSPSLKASDYYRRETTSLLTETMKSRRASYHQRRKMSSKEGKESVVFISFLFPDNKEEDFMSELKPWKKFGSHKLDGSHLCLSFHETLMISCGQDGTLKIFDLESAKTLFSIRCVNFWEKGINVISLSLGNRFVVCSGYNKLLACFEINEQPLEENISLAQHHKTSFLQMIKNDQHNEHMEFGRLISTSYSHLEEERAYWIAVDKLKILEDIRRAIKNDDIYMPVPPRLSPSMPWFNKRLLEILEEEEFICNQFKNLLRTKITQLRRVLKKMLKENEEMEGMEKIPHYEFDLDVDEQKTAQALCDEEVQKLKDDGDVENKAKNKLIKAIKKECWDDMHIKGRGVKAFLSEMMVHNYPMKERSEDEIRELMIVSAHRRVEVAEQQIRMKVGENALLMKKSKHSDQKSEDDYEKDENIFELRTQNAVSGSLAAMAGGENDLFYSQFEICTKFQKIKQIVLLKDSIYRIQMGFNKDFDTLLALKAKNISSIKEKNQRIRKIIKDINSNDFVVDPDLNTYEKPELLFFTPDEEVRVEKFLTPEEWKKQEEEKRVEEERKLREKKDNWRERGLEKMMGGVLEIKKEDELKKDIPAPTFVVEKGEEKWSEEERQVAADYRLQLKNLEEEREKFKKFQEVELKKLQAFVTDMMQEFDAKVSNLISRKILVQSAINQEELMLYRLRHSILLEEQTNLKEKQLFIQLEEAKEKSNQKLMSLMQAKKFLDEYQNVYDTYNEEDKQHERVFKKDFHDVPHNHLENLFKLYKKRPKRPKSRIGEELLHDRQQLSCSNEDCMLYVINFMAELDGIRNMPEGLNPIFWDQLCHYRHEKVLKELLLRNHAAHLFMLQNRVTVLQSKAEKAKHKIEDIFNNINQLNSSRHHFYRNMEVQLLLKQGQVEVEVSDFLPIYRTSLLLHKDVVEELNKNIKSLGENKIATMIESKSFKKEIAQLEWEHKKMEMELQDLKNKMKDIANFKVTKDVLSFLSKDNYDEIKSQEVQTLEKTINVTKEFHKKNLNHKREKLLSVDHAIKNVIEQNKQMVEDLKLLNSSILERKRIRDVVVEKSGMAKSERAKRHTKIVRKSKLSELARSQVEEIKTLKEEIENLKTKTFPFLPADQKKLL